jgi:hypothetical protein
MPTLFCHNPSCGLSSTVPDNVSGPISCPYCHWQLALPAEEEARPQRPRKRRRREQEHEDTEDESGSLSPLNIVGIVLLGLGGVLTLVGCFQPTTVSSDLGSLHNLGLLLGKLVIVLIGLTISTIGAIFLAAPSSRSRLE